MKKKVFVLVHIIVLLAVILCSCLDKKPEEIKKENYPMTVVVDRIEDNHVVVCVDCNQNEWAFEDSNDWQEGDIVSLLMNNCGTATIYDDEIIRVKYNGTVKGLQ